MSNKIIIAHRGNSNGPSSAENSIESITSCLNLGFNVEVDVWSVDGKFWLGHDAPTIELDYEELLLDERIWCHAKNLQAASALKELGAIFFWHQTDDITLTSNGYLWTFPGKKLTKHSIAVLPERKTDVSTFHLACGICTDYPLRYIDHE